MITIVLPWPPSVNTYWRRVGNRTLLSRKGRAYKSACLAAVIDQLGVPDALGGELGVLVELFPPDRRKRDIDNTAKAILDGLTSAGVWGDDQQVSDLRLVRCKQSKGGMAKVTVWEAK